MDKDCRKCKYWTTCMQYGDKAIGMLIRRKSENSESTYLGALLELVPQLDCLSYIPISGSLSEAIDVFNRHRRQWDI